jgi:hypothetical protein
MEGGPEGACTPYTYTIASFTRVGPTNYFDGCYALKALRNHYTFIRCGLEVTG